jgi:hypothetical protein
MALSQAPSRTASHSSKRKPLSAARIYQAWSAECSNAGRRGALKRTADLVGCSPEYIRQLVAKHEAAHTLAPELFTTHELDYCPAPGEIQLRPPAQPQPTASKDATESPTDGCADYVSQLSESRSCTGETGEESQLATGKQSQVAEPENAVLPLGDLPTVAPQTPVLHTDVLPGVAVRRYAPRPAPRTRLDLAQLVDVLTYQIGPVPVAGVLAFLLLVLLLGMR